MRKSIKLSILCISATVLAFGCLTGAVAQTAPYTYENGTSAASRGVIEIGGGAKFDSRDLEKIYTEVSVGKGVIETAITSADLAAPTKAGTVYTFTELATGVNPWDDLQSGLGYYTKDSEGNYTKGSTKRTTLYNSVSSIESLDKAIADDNISFMSSDEGKEVAKDLGYLNLYTFTMSCERNGYLRATLPAKPKYIYIDRLYWPEFSNRSHSNFNLIEFSPDMIQGATYGFYNDSLNVFYFIWNDYTHVFTLSDTNYGAPCSKAYNSSTILAFY